MSDLKVRPPVATRTRYVETLLSDRVGTRRHRSSLRTGILVGFLVNHNDRTPLFFVSVAYKGVRAFVSSLFSTLTEDSISVDSKGAYIAPKLCKDAAFSSDLLPINGGGEVVPQLGQSERPQIKKAADMPPIEEVPHSDLAGILTKERRGVKKLPVWVVG
jgi:hypothetical protein